MKLKRLLSILTLITALGFILPTSAEAAKHKSKHKKSGHSDNPQQYSSAPQRIVASPIPRPRAGPILFSNRYGPVVIQRVPRRAPVGPRRPLFDFLLRR